VYGDDNNILDGYDWKKLPEMTKDAIVLGYMKGFSIGLIGGGAQVIDATKRHYVLYNENYTKSQKDKIAISNFLQQVTEDITPIMKSIILATENMKESPYYYRRELDSFLATYPLCMKKDVFKIFILLCWKWSKFNNVTYKEISEQICE
jgi:hypothetical protein